MTVHRKKRWVVHRVVRDIGTGMVDGLRNAWRLSDTALSVVVFAAVFLLVWTILSVVTG